MVPLVPEAVHRQSYNLICDGLWNVCMVLALLVSMERKPLSFMIPTALHTGKEADVCPRSGPVVSCSVYLRIGCVILSCGAAAFLISDPPE